MAMIYTPGFLIFGDILALGLVTVFGFMSHGMLETAGWRMLTTFIPLMISWFFVGVPAGLFKLDDARDWRKLWMPFWGMVFASPMAAVLRGFWLDSPILPIFVIILGGFSALAILTWRVLFWGLSRRFGQTNG